MGAPGSGKREHQKLKSYIVLQILLRETDENHTLRTFSMFEGKTESV